ncbi:MAG: cytochrome C [Alphaproteobacteria bacterium]|nr:cytochrome C [Alphaproteobacteria bacterium]
MSVQIVRLLGVVAAFTGAGEASAQTGDAARGLSYARRACAECHMVEKGERPQGRLLSGPSFERVAAVPGMTGMALTAWLTTSHPTMPNFIIEADRMDDLVAYIRSLAPSPG